MNEEMIKYITDCGYANHIITGGIEQLLLNWNRAVNEIINNKPINIYEYINDLDGRRILGELIQFIDGKDKETIEEYLKLIDNNFLEMTTEQPSSINTKKGIEEKNDINWIYYRQPKYLEE